jgi:hypothetical protein
MKQDVDGHRLLNKHTEPNRPKFYPFERIAIRIIARFQDRGQFKFTMDEFMKEFCVYHKMRRQNVTTLLRRVSKKLSVTNCRLDRISGLGRSARAVYRTEGYFSDIELKKD